MAVEAADEAADGSTGGTAGKAAGRSGGGTADKSTTGSGDSTADGNARPYAAVGQGVVADATAASRTVTGSDSAKTSGSDADGDNTTAAGAVEAQAGAVDEAGANVRSATATDDARADEAVAGTGSGSDVVLGYLAAYVRVKALPTWKSPRSKKSPAPAWTMANPFGTVTVDKNRSLWCPQVCMSDIKPAFEVPALASGRLKLGSVDDTLVVTALAVIKRKSIADIITELMVLCSIETDMSRIIDGTLEASFEARPARHSSLVQCRLDIQPESANADGVQRDAAGGGRTPAAAVAEADSAAGAVLLANVDGEQPGALPPGSAAAAAGEDAVVGDGGAPPGAVLLQEPLSCAGASAELTVRVQMAMGCAVGRKVNVQALAVVGRGRGLAVLAQRVEKELLVTVTASGRTPTL